MREELAFETIVTGYGLTESTGIATMCRHDDDTEIIANTAGRAIPGMELKIVDEQGNALPPGEPGEVQVRGYNVMKGYFNDPEATAEAIDADGWLHTGDIGIIDDAGNLKITDRIKDMFIVGGFNAYPAEIENIMMTNPAVGQVAVVGVPDHRMGEVGVAFVVPRAGATVEPDELVAWCREHMANYKVPRRVEVVDAFPLNASGKVLKYQLREKAAAVASGAMSFDHVVVGGGSAGVTLAARVSPRIPSRHVLLLEAGDTGPLDSDADLLSNINFALTARDWGMHAAGHARAPARVPAGQVPRRRVVGERRAGVPGEPRRLRRLGRGGQPELVVGAHAAPLPEPRARPRLRRRRRDPRRERARSPSCGGTATSCSRCSRRSRPRPSDAGLPWVDDHNAPDSTGIGPLPMNRVAGRRMSTALTYYVEARERPNLTVWSARRHTRCSSTTGAPPACSSSAATPSRPSTPAR